jgi:hypothetical protein
MGRTACTKPQCLHKGVLYLTVVYRILTSHGLYESMLFQILRAENMQSVVYWVATVSSLLSRF